MELSTQQQKDIQTEYLMNMTAKKLNHYQDRISIGENNEHSNTTTG